MKQHSDKVACLDYLTVVVDEVCDPVGHNHRQDDPKQVVYPSRPFHHEHHQRDGRPLGRGSKHQE